MKLLTYKQAAAFLNVELGTLYAWVHHKRVPFIRLSPRTVRFDEAELERWIGSRRQEPNTA